MSTFACSVAVMIGTTAQAQPTVVLHVDGDTGDVPPPFGNADGTEWGPLAFKFLQDGLEEAAFQLDQPGVQNVQLWVAATVETNPYRPDQCATCGPSGSGLRTATFNLINNVEVYGGFLGTDHKDTPETQLSQRDPENNETVLSGELTAGINPPVCEDAQGDCYEVHPTPGCDDPACCTAVCAINPFCCGAQGWTQSCVDTAAQVCPTARLNAYHVVTADGVDATARIDGFTITKGFASGAETAGGGMLIVVGETSGVADPLVVRCTFVQNVAERGGGMRILGSD